MNNEQPKRFYFPELDGLRFLAFILVFAHHNPFFLTVPSLVFLKAYGWLGVDLFFVLSAFLFTRLLVEEYKKTEKISFRKFYIRRIFRIYPVYILFVLVSVLFLYVTNHTFSDIEFIRIAGLVTFTDNIMTAIYGYHSLSTFSHLWTISFEEQFYLFVPLTIWLLVKMTKKRRIISLFVFMFVFGVLRQLLVESMEEFAAVWLLPITRFESILGGVILGFGGYNFLLKYFSPLFAVLLGILSFFVFTLLPPLEENYSYVAVYFLLIGLSTSLVLFGVSQSNILKKIFSTKILVYLGKRSYGLYLYHLFGIEFSAYLLRGTSFGANNGFIFFLLSLVITIFASILSYNLIEKPFLKLKKKYEVVQSRPI